MSSNDVFLLVIPSSQAFVAAAVALSTDLFEFFMLCAASSYLADCCSCCFSTSLFAMASAASISLARSISKSSTPSIVVATASLPFLRNPSRGLGMDGSFTLLGNPTSFFLASQKLLTISKISFWPPSLLLFFAAHGHP